MVIILTEAEDQSCAINGRIKIGSNRHANAYCGKTDGGRCSPNLNPSESVANYSRIKDKKQ